MRYFMDHRAAANINAPILSTTSLGTHFAHSTLVLRTQACKHSTEGEEVIAFWLKSRVQRLSILYAILWRHHKM